MLTRINSIWARSARAFSAWLDNGHSAAATDDRVDWLRVLPFIGMHAACFGIFWVGISTTAVVVTIAMYAIRMIAITGFYHRYFSHRTFRTSRTMQFLFALLGATAVQRGP